MEKGSFCKHDGTPPFILAIICCMQTDTQQNAKNKRNTMFIHFLAACKLSNSELKKYQKLTRRCASKTYKTAWENVSIIFDQFIQKIMNKYGNEIFMNKSSNDI